MTFDKVINSAEMAKQLLVMAAAGAVLYYVYKGSKVVVDGVTGAAESIAETWVEINNPIVNAQIRIKPQYFDTNGQLIDAAYHVISENYPNLYRVAFDENRRLRPEYSAILNGEPVTDESFT